MNAEPQRRKNNKPMDTFDNPRIKDNYSTIKSKESENYCRSNLDNHHDAPAQTRKVNCCTDGTKFTQQKNNRYENGKNPKM